MNKPPTSASNSRMSARPSFLRLVSFAPFAFAGLTVAACGGASPNAADPSSTSSGSIASMPAYPAPSASAQAPAPSASASTDPKQICASAQPVADKPSASSSLLSPRSLNDLLTKSTIAADDADAAERSSARQAKSGTYSMADLQALRKRSSWDEILDHAEDVAPAQRTGAWDSLVEAAATGYLAAMTTRTDSFEGIFASQALVQRYPHLTASPAFMAKRADAGKMAAETCLENAYRGQHCIDMMKDFLQTTNTDASVGFAFGKIARKNQNAYVAVPFFDWALAKKAGDAATCSDDDLQLATIAGLGLPTDDENAAGARRIAEGSCWSTMKDAVTKGFGDSSGSYYRDNACAVLKAKGAL